MPKSTKYIRLVCAALILYSLNMKAYSGETKITPINTPATTQTHSATNAVSSSPTPDPSKWGDQGDGTFFNPILPGDYSDPDVIRVGSDYYLITSTFQYSPGMAILHSRDLVNWRFIGHCFSDLTQLGPELNWDRMNRYNRGIYAGSLRHHDGKFWVFTTTIDEGVFMTTAEKPEGPWAPAHKIWDREHIDDNCPFWDDDGQAYMLFSTPGSKWFTRMVRMSPDGKSVDPASERVIDAHQTSEGNKIYKIDGWYYIFHNQCEIAGPGDRYIERTGVFMRSKNIWGPYEKRVILRGRRNVPHFEDEPNQGGLVQTEKGDWWFITHQGRGAFQGRASSLLPVVWKDGWPHLGEPDELGIGSITWSGRKPLDGIAPHAPQASDDFTAPTLGHQWEWNYQPRADKWSLTERPGFLRLRAFKPVERPADTKNPFPPGVLLNAGNTLTQRLMTPAGGTATVRLEIGQMADGQTAGFGLFSKEYGVLAVRQTNGERRIVYLANQSEEPGPVATGNAIFLRATMNAQGKANFSYGTDEEHFLPIGPEYTMKWAWYRGIRLALFTFNERQEAGIADFTAFRYNFPGPRK